MTTHPKGVFAPGDCLLRYACVAFEVSVAVSRHALRLSRSHPDLEREMARLATRSGCGDGGGKQARSSAVGRKPSEPAYAGEQREQTTTAASTLTSGERCGERARARRHSLNGEVQSERRTGCKRGLQ